MINKRKDLLIKKLRYLKYNIIITYSKLHVNSFHEIYKIKRLTICFS